MPVQVSYPGVYIEELPSGVRPVTGVATSVTAFVGYTARGLDDRATRVFSFGDFERAFGGLAADSVLSYGVQHFFLNGGSEAVVVRVPKTDSVAASITAYDGDDAATDTAALAFTALSRGAWANDVIVDVDYDAIPAADTDAFNLTLTDLVTGDVERFPAVSMDTGAARFVEKVVNDEATGSRMVAVEVADAAAGRPQQTGTVSGTITLGALANDSDYQVRVSLDAPSGITNVNVVVIATGEALPGSMLGLCALLERKLNLAIGGAVPGARVTCVPSDTGTGVRVRAAMPLDVHGDAVDAVITFSSGAANSILTDLALSPATRRTANASHYRLGLGRTAAGQDDATEGADGTQLPGTAALIGSSAASTGIHALDRVDLFNLLAVPDAARHAAGDTATPDPSVDAPAVYTAALAYCTARRAFLLVDPPANARSVDAAVDWISGSIGLSGPNAAAYWPRVLSPDPLDDFALRVFSPSGVIAGLAARTDAARGVWKAPAGTEAALLAVRGLDVALTDAENGVLNPLGLNCLRTFPVYGSVAWGARTIDGADAKASQWKYVPVRRLALMIEESVYRGTKWAVFEPNDEQLWGQLRMNLTAFMHGLFRQSAFQGSTPREAYLVKCDAETTTQADIDRGIVNVVVGFAPLKPAEFVVIRIQQLAGQSAT